MSTSTFDKLKKKGKNVVKTAASATKDALWPTECVGIFLRPIHRYLYLKLTAVRVRSHHLDCTRL